VCVCAGKTTLVSTIRGGSRDYLSVTGTVRVGKAVFPAAQGLSALLEIMGSVPQVATDRLHTGGRRRDTGPSSG
jgi:hypothetical protein